MSNSKDTDQARHMSNFVWPDLGLNCLRCSSADETSRQRAKSNWFVNNALPNIGFFSIKVMLLLL